jgi:hypothetical protein
MEFKIVMPADLAEQEVNKLLDLKKIFPKQRERMSLVIDEVVEAMVYGYVTIEADGKIIQKLVEPSDILTEIVYAPRIDPMVLNKKLNELKKINNQTVSLVYICCYTGLLEAQVNKLCQKDKNIADAIALFFQ